MGVELYVQSILVRMHQADKSSVYHHVHFLKIIVSIATGFCLTKHPNIHFNSDTIGTPKA